MKKEVIELNVMWYGGQFGFYLNEHSSKIDDSKLNYFWKKVEELGVWKWHKKYPYWKQKYEPMLDGCDWKLKLRNRDGRAKFCSGYESFPRKFKDLIKELNKLFGSEIEF